MAASIDSSTRIEPRRVQPEHHADKYQRNQVRRDREAEDVEDVLEAPGVAKRALGQRAGELSWKNARSFASSSSIAST